MSQNDTKIEIPVSLRDLKAGDNVFVVHQSRRGQAERRTENAQIVRVGRKYAYITQYGDDAPFCRDTGFSVHPKDCNARVNGAGFDVYVDESAYRKEQSDREEKLRLEKRIITSYGRLVDLPPEIVNAINSILDSEDLGVNND